MSHYLKLQNTYLNPYFLKISGLKKAPKKKRVVFKDIVHEDVSLEEHEEQVGPQRYVEEVFLPQEYKPEELPLQAPEAPILVEDKPKKEQQVMDQGIDSTEMVFSETTDITLKEKGKPSKLIRATEPKKGDEETIEEVPILIDSAIAPKGQEVTTALESRKAPSFDVSQTYVRPVSVEASSTEKQYSTDIEMTKKLKTRLERTPKVVEEKPQEEVREQVLFEATEIENTDIALTEGDKPKKVKKKPSIDFEEQLDEQLVTIVSIENPDGVQHDIVLGSSEYPDFDIEQAYKTPIDVSVLSPDELVRSEVDMSPRIQEKPDEPVIIEEIVIEKVPAERKYEIMSDVKLASKLKPTKEKKKRQELPMEVEEPLASQPVGISIGRYTHYKTPKIAVSSDELPDINIQQRYVPSIEVEAIQEKELEFTEIEASGKTTTVKEVEGEKKEIPKEVVEEMSFETIATEASEVTVTFPAKKEEPTKKQLVQMEEEKITEQPIAIISLSQPTQDTDRIIVIETVIYPEISTVEQTYQRPVSVDSVTPETLKRSEVDALPRRPSETPFVTEDKETKIEEAAPERKPFEPAATATSEIVLAKKDEPKKPKKRPSFAKPDEIQDQPVAIVSMGKPTEDHQYSIVVKSSELPEINVEQAYKRPVELDTTSFKRLHRSEIEARPKKGTIRKVSPEKQEEAYAEEERFEPCEVETSAITLMQKDKEKRPRKRPSVQSEEEVVEQLVAIISIDKLTEEKERTVEVKSHEYPDFEVVQSDQRPIRIDFITHEELKHSEIIAPAKRVIETDIKEVKGGDDKPAIAETLFETVMIETSDVTLSKPQKPKKPSLIREKDKKPTEQMIDIISISKPSEKTSYDIVVASDEYTDLTVSQTYKRSIETDAVAYEEPKHSEIQALPKRILEDIPSLREFVAVKIPVETTSEAMVLFSDRKEVTEKPKMPVPIKEGETIFEAPMTIVSTGKLVKEKQYDILVESETYPELEHVYKRPVDVHASTPVALQRSELETTKVEEVLAEIATVEKVVEAETKLIVEGPDQIPFEPTVEERSEVTLARKEIPTRPKKRPSIMTKEETTELPFTIVSIGQPSVSKQYDIDTDSACYPDFEVEQIYKRPIHVDSTTSEDLKRSELQVESKQSVVEETAEEKKPKEKVPEEVLFETLLTETSGVNLAEKEKPIKPTKKPSVQKTEELIQEKPTTIVSIGELEPEKKYEIVVQSKTYLDIDVQQIYLRPIDVKSTLLEELERSELEAEGKSIIVEEVFEEYIPKGEVPEKIPFETSVAETLSVDLVQTKKTEKPKKRPSVQKVEEEIQEKLVIDISLEVLKREEVHDITAESKAYPDVEVEQIYKRPVSTNSALLEDFKRSEFEIKCKPAVVEEKIIEKDKQQEEVPEEVPFEATVAETSSVDLTGKEKPTRTKKRPSVPKIEEKIQEKSITIVSIGELRPEKQYEILVESETYPDFDIKQTYSRPIDTDSTSLEDLKHMEIEVVPKLKKTIEKEVIIVEQPEEEESVEAPFQAIVKESGEVALLQEKRPEKRPVAVEQKEQYKQEVTVVSIVKPKAEEKHDITCMSERYFEVDVKQTYKRPITVECDSKLTEEKHVSIVEAVKKREVKEHRGKCSSIDKKTAFFFSDIKITYRTHNKTPYQTNTRSRFVLCLNETLLHA